MASAHFGDPAYLDLPYAADFVHVRAAGDPLRAHLAHIVSRASSLISSYGDTLLPPGSALDRNELDDRHVLRVWLTVPADSGFDEISELRVASIDHVLALPLAADPMFGGASIQVRVGSGDYRALGTYLPPFPAALKERPATENPVSASTVLREKFMSPQTEVTPQSLGGPLANADGQPAGALSGVVVFCSAGHGWTAGTSSWGLQRPLLLEMVEDYGNIDQLNIFVQYLYNAGAVVVPFRPVGYQNIEIVLDNDDPGVTYAGSWSNSSSIVEYYENGTTVSGVPYRFATAAVTQSATARYTPGIATAGFYPVYCWTPDSTNRVTQTYRIQHSGGTASMKIDHRRVGKGWIWLGTYYFEQGSSGYVEIANQSTDTGVVIADAIRFGNGMGDIVRPGPNTISGYPRNEECSRYWAQSEAGNNAVGMSSSIWETGSNDNGDNVGTAGRWAAVMNNMATNNDRWRRVYVEWHSNAAGCAGGPPCTAKGTVALVSASAPTTNQHAFATILGDKLEADMLIADSGFEYLWGARSNPYIAEFGAISTNANDNEFDATIVEVAFHDNPEDAANLRNLKVRDAVARSVTQGLIQFLNSLSGSQVPLVFAPDAPRQVKATHDGTGNVVLSWLAPASDSPNGGSPTGYRIYRSSNGYGFGQALDVGNVTVTSLNTASGVTTYLRVAAYNAGGESMPSETLAVRRASSGPAQVLIVNGFDRVSRQQNVIQQIPAGPMERQVPRRTNSFDYIVEHAVSLGAADYTFDSASNEAVIAGTAPLTGYGAVVWILGRESTVDQTFNSSEQALVTSYLNAGGRLFVTGTEIGFDLVSQGNGVSFFQNTLRGAYGGDDAGTFSASGTAGCLTGLGSVSFGVANGAPYVASFPDLISPQSGAISILSYSGGGGSAGIQYDSGLYRVVMFGFPFECIGSSAVRNDVMGRVMGFLEPGGGGLRADFDEDGDVDLTDFAHLQACLTSASAPLTPECQDANFDGDSNVDTGDFNIFLGCLTGANIEPDPDCAN